jgi:hypothetical protein
MLASEPVQAAIVLLANGDIGRLRQALHLAAADWRDLLVAAGLADEDWPVRLDRELGERTQMNHRTFDALGFSPSYSCQPDPELPGDGDWRCPVHGFRRDGSIAAGPFRSRWGTPLVARFELAEGTQWVGLFEAGGLGGLDGVFACPDPASPLHASNTTAERVAFERPSNQVSNNHHRQRWTPANTHGRSIPAQACCDAGCPCQFLTSGRRGPPRPPTPGRRAGLDHPRHPTRTPGH